MVKPRENRMHMYLSNEELEAIDDWRFKNRIATRSEAIRRLCSLGLAIDSRLDGLFEARMALGGGLLDLWRALGVVDNDLNVKRNLDQNIPLEAAANNLISKVHDLEIATRELHDHAFSAKHAGNIQDALEQIERTNEIYDRLLGRTIEDGSTPTRTAPQKKHSTRE